MRKLFFLFVALLATTALWAHSFEVDGIYYNYLDDNNVEVTLKGSDYYSSAYFGEVSIPETITNNGITYSVTGIGCYTFCYSPSVSSIIIPNSVTSIGERAFDGCLSLTSITCKAATPPILGPDPFVNCYQLPTIYIPDNTLSAYQQAWGNKYSFVNNETTLSLHVEIPGTL